jgi:PEP-CTERM/exosortase A-associated glycosyltransferase
MKILHILDHSIPLHSGYTFRTRAILQQQREFGWETDHITSYKHNCATIPVAEEEDIDGFHFFRIAKSDNPLLKFPAINQWLLIRLLEKRLQQVVEKISPDILHAHSPALNGIAALRVAKKYNLPLVYEIRAFWEDAAVDHGTSKEWGLRYRLTRALETHVVKNVDAVTTICEGLRKDIMERGVPETKITVIPNAVDIERFQFDVPKDAELSAQYSVKDAIVLGFLGSFYAYEGLSLLIQAITKVDKDIPNLKILLVGGGPQEKALKELVLNLNLSGRVIFTGRVPHDQVQRYYSLIDVFIYPRLSMRLTELVTPLKPLEAMARGGIVLASDIGGHRELIQNGKTGILFKADDEDALAHSIVDLIQHKSKWPAISKFAREYVVNERNWKNSVSRYKNIYESLIRKS